jgi:uncharacterized Fe-S cluster protein YjdI
MEKKTIVKEYKNNDIKVIWTPDLCIHSTICYTRLPKVFQLGKRPWIRMENGITEDIIDIVEACPTAALEWKWIDESKNIIKEKTMEENKNNKATEPAKIFANGPLMVPKSIDITDANGNVLRPGEDKFICRCGHSKNKPFCDGSHMAMGFEG